MKRKSNLYENIYKIENIQSAFNEVCRNTKNKRKVELFKEYRCLYIRGKVKKFFCLHNTNKKSINSLLCSINSFYTLDKKYTEKCLKNLKRQ